MFIPDYYQMNCSKVALGIDSASGLIIWPSRSYLGRLGDESFADPSTGMLKLIGSGQKLMTDKGFLLHEQLSNQGSLLIVPPKKKVNQESQRKI